MEAWENLLVRIKTSWKEEIWRITKFMGDLLLSRKKIDIQS